ncbi:hypothetical protein [Streptomyces capitiformicae]|uniref:S-adenosylmethionine-dependent methyltransferase Rv2258c-like winged HTH domain-containing protein n=1 Tax=Streptomyces capitiformicae TaxID=2014920 RepID=A0A918ZN76_9ACTN|nr:hypothetical protein [Streptomyces capitiformicae]GHE59998.1 hypothetical protein GCM10017771_83060 [Streptomyces capitiformicae]
MGKLAQDLNERYVRERLRGLTAAGCLEEPEPGRFTLPAEHAPALADEKGPMFLDGVHQMMPAALAPYEQLTEAFRSGGGVRQSDYPDIAQVPRICALPVPGAAVGASPAHGGPSRSSEAGSGGDAGSGGGACQASGCRRDFRNTP